MHTLKVLYRPPAGAPSTTTASASTCRLARKRPGVPAVRLSLDVGGGDGRRPELTGGAAAQADLPNLARGGLEILYFPARTG
ncbi:MAG: hypothetical protein QOC93_719 [Actinomycetota bacterium]|nr:hypothetical protein [Actinomycetota bacterium]